MYTIYTELWKCDLLKATTDASDRDRTGDLSAQSPMRYQLRKAPRYTVAKVHYLAISILVSYVLNSVRKSLANVHIAMNSLQSLCQQVLSKYFSSNYMPIFMLGVSRYDLGLRMLKLAN